MAVLDNISRPERVNGSNDGQVERARIAFGNGINLVDNNILPVVIDKRSLAAYLQDGRLTRVRLMGKVLARFTGTSLGRRCIRNLRSFGPGRECLDWCVGFRKPFPTLKAAELCAASYLPFDHSHPDNATVHLSLSEGLRPSDYPVLFYLETIGPISGVFDIGGNVGNLFYSYRRHLGHLKQASWQVYDVPSMVSIGKSLAKDRGESQLFFADELVLPPDTSVVLASGSLHYFDETIGQMLARQNCRPEHVFINRTPLLPHHSAVTVQDAGSYLAPCKLHNRDSLVLEMLALGYECVDEWPVFELRLIIPCYPELSARLYSGLYFRLRKKTQTLVVTDKRQQAKRSHRVAH
jgi:putative methyltransferase (TIGR04325 family)